ncbi:MAG: VOC family protein [Bacilli bacterium]|nr:VOC family protein [Bacilli bacterium]MDD4733939.1 VOC family protein [Bacilli bacterium]
MKFNKMIPELLVTDIKKSKEFYVDILGFELMYERVENGFVFLQLKDDIQIMLNQLTEDDNWITGDMDYPFGRGINLSIEVSNVEEIYNRINSKKHKIFIEMKDNYYRQNDIMLGNREFLIMDPDGYLLRFNQDIGEYKLGE